MATSVPAPAAHKRTGGIARYFAWSTDHKVIGVQYILTSFTFFLIGGILSELIRVELLTPPPNLVANGSVWESQERFTRMLPCSCLMRQHRPSMPKPRIASRRSCKAFVGSAPRLSSPIDCEPFVRATGLPCLQMAR